MATVRQDRSLKWYATREPIILGVLTLIALTAFAGVTALSKLYHKDQQFRGNRWYIRGVSDLKTGNWPRAVTDFHTALLFSRDNYAYQLGLAQALAAEGDGGRDQSYVYLRDLWERQPENGTVNLELARILAEKGEKEQALRYYHNAIYASWGENPDSDRRSARFELVQFLLHENASTQAQAELIALSGDLPADATLHIHVGDLFLQTQDYQHALAEYRVALKIDHQDPAAMEGIGKAAYQMASYSLSQHYLQEAVTAGAGGGSEQLLNTVNLILKMDPFRRQLTASRRARIVVEAFDTAGERLKTCVVPEKSPPIDTVTNAGSSANPEPTLSAQWAAMKPKVNEASLLRNPDAVEAAMDLVFTIERETADQCGTATGADLALFLISKLHEGS